MDGRCVGSKTDRHASRMPGEIPKGCPNKTLSLARQTIKVALGIGPAFAFDTPLAHVMPGRVYALGAQDAGHGHSGSPAGHELDEVSSGGSHCISGRGIVQGPLRLHGFIAHLPVFAPHNVSRF